METTRFDQLASSFAQIQTRRHALRFLGLAAVGSGAWSLLLTEEGDARKRRRNKKKKNKKGGKNGGGQPSVLPPGARCESTSQCATPDNHRICEVAVNASNSDRTCCGATGAICGAPNGDGDATAPYCCTGYYCALNSQSNITGTGVCQPIP